MKTKKIVNGSPLTCLLRDHTNPRQYKKIVLIMMLLIFPFFRGSAHNTMNYSVQANIIYHFTKYINWPVNRKAGDFIIGVVGETPLFDELKKILVNKKTGTQDIVVRHFSPSQVNYDCHILFLSEEEGSSLKKIVSHTQNNPVLLVCEEEGAASKGACISFNIVSDRMKLQINKNNIDQRDLSIANELLRLGTLVN